MRRPLSIALVALAAAGCASAAARFYTLDSTATPRGAPGARHAIVVGPVSLPEAVDRPQFVLQVAPNQVAIDEFNRWAAPLDDGIARAVAGDLAALLAGSRVATAPVPDGFAPTHRVTIDVQRFDSAPGDAVTIDAVWAVRPSAGRTARSGRTVAREPVQGNAPAAIAAAHSRALATMSNDIAAAIRAGTDRKR